MSEAEKKVDFALDEEADNGGLTQCDEGKESTPIMFTQMGEEDENLQEYWNNVYNDVNQGPAKVGHVGILECAIEANSGNATPLFFFIKDSIATLGSSYATGTNCDIAFAGMQNEGMSNIALRFELKEGRLSVSSSNSKATSFQVVKADGLCIFLVKGATQEVLHGDSIVFGKLDAGKFVSIKVLSFHRAPTPPCSNNNIGTQSTSIAAVAATSLRAAYPKSRPAAVEKAKREKQKVAKAMSKLHSGKRTTLPEKKRAREIISRSEQKNCEHEKHYGFCTDAKCPFFHRKRQQQNGKPYASGDCVTAVVRNWNEACGYGFARAGDGTDFYLHRSKFRLDTMDLRQGDRVEFNVRLTNKGGQCDEAIDVSLK